MWPERSPADARDALLPAGQIRTITGAVGFASAWSLGAMWPERSPADAHDAFLPARQICAITGAVGFASAWSLGRNAAQLMLMMLSSRLVKSAHSLGWWVLLVPGA